MARRRQRGRPRLFRRSQIVGATLDSATVRRIDRFARDTVSSRAEAVRALLNLGLRKASA